MWDSETSNPVTVHIVRWRPIEFGLVPHRSGTHMVKGIDEIQAPPCQTFPRCKGILFISACKLKRKVQRQYWTTTLWKPWAFVVLPSSEADAEDLAREENIVSTAEATALNILNRQMLSKLRNTPSFWSRGGANWEGGQGEAEKIKQILKTLINDAFVPPTYGYIW